MTTTIFHIYNIKKGEEYYIFRYITDSHNVGADLMGKWLIGWTNNDGGTFSNFDLYSEYEQKTIEKTLKKSRKDYFKRNSPCVMHKSNKRIMCHT